MRIDALESDPTDIKCMEWKEKSAMWKESESNRGMAHCLKLSLNIIAIEWISSIFKKISAMFLYEFVV